MISNALLLRWALGAVASVALTFSGVGQRISAAAEAAYDIELKAGELDRRHSPVSVTLDLPADLAGMNPPALVLIDPAGKRHAAQLTAVPLLASNAPAPGDKPARRLNFIVDRLPRGAVEHWTLTATSGEASSGADAVGFRWQDTPGDHDDLVFRDGQGAARPVLRYMYHPLDESSKESREATFKVFHHVFDPTGVTLLTKGVGGLYTHHRGLFFGFNRVSYDGKTADVWHCTGDAHQSHDDFLASEAGPVLGRHRLSIGWHGPAKETFAMEHRELTAYAPATAVSELPAGTLVEFASRVRPTKGEVKLDGDPQHAGFHFRASNEVNERIEQEKKDGVKSDKLTYYIRPDGVGKLGETRNWDAGNAATKDQVNFPWKGMSFVVADKRYTVAYLDKPTNPKEARFSERDYGRFGSYFETTITPEHPLEVNYRVWIQAGEMKPEDIAALDDDFNHPIAAMAAAKR